MPDRPEGAGSCNETVRRASTGAYFPREQTETSAGRRSLRKKNSPPSPTKDPPVNDAGASKDLKAPPLFSIPLTAGKQKKGNKKPFIHKPNLAGQRMME